MPDIAAPFGNYSPAGGGFSSTATATTLKDGRILVIGTAPAAAIQCLFACADGISGAIYNPANGGSSLTARPTTITSYGFTATLLANGKVLVVGGGAELYDPSTDRWSTAGPVPVARIDHTATLLADGRVLVAGGLSRPPDPTAGYDRLTSVNIYDPKSNNWSGAPDLPFTLGDQGDTATLLRDGRVLVVGSNTSASLFDPKANRWSAVATLAEPAQLPHTAILLPDGRVLILGSCADRPSFNCDRFATPQLFDPATESWSPAAPMINGREAFSATLLANGHVLVAGGDGPASVVTSGELYDPTANRWAATADMKLARAGHIATLLRNGSVLVIGGFFLGNLRSAELYTPPGAQASVPAVSTASTPRSQFAGLNAALVGGAVLLTGVVVVFLLARLAGRRRAVH
jgi:N-acetylneuraminic acid mutarotase